MLGLMHNSCSPATQNWHWEQVIFGLMTTLSRTLTRVTSEPTSIDVSRSVAAEDMGLVKAEPGAPDAEPGEYVDAVDGAGPDADLDIVGSDDRVRHVAVGQHLAPAVLSDVHGLHFNS